MFDLEESAIAWTAIVYTFRCKNGFHIRKAIRKPAYITNIRS
jgi:hypothetical protein